MSEEQRNPTITDYMAGVMLANGIVWIWAMALATFSDFFSKIPYIILAFIAYVIYISGATLASYLVCKRTSSKHLVVGLKLAGLAWFFSLIMMLGSTTGPTPTLAIVLPSMLWRWRHGGRLPGPKVGVGIKENHSR